VVFTTVLKKQNASYFRKLGNNCTVQKRKIKGTFTGVNDFWVG